MKEQVWFKARVISSHGRHSFVEKEDGTVLEATRKGKKVDLAVGDIVDCLQTSAEQVSIQKIEQRRSLLFHALLISFWIVAILIAASGWEE